MIKNIIKTCLSNCLVVIAGIVISFIFPVILSIEDYAYYQKYLLYCSYINIFHLGMSSGMYLKYAGKKYLEMDMAQYKSEVNLLYVILGTFTFIFLFIASFSHNLLYVILGFSIIPICIVETYIALYQAWNRFTGYAIINTLPKTLLVVFVLLLKLSRHDITGKNIVYIYLLIQTAIAVYFFIEFKRSAGQVKAKKMLSYVNGKVLKEGFLIHLGNYINILFHSIDRQFINIFYGIHSFAMYSFAMSAQSMITVFITSISQPFYPKLAQGKMKEEEYGMVKEIVWFSAGLMAAGYFVIKFVLTNYIVKYSESLRIIFIFFFALPAISLINILYLNLYKVEKRIKRYTVNLFIVLMISVLLDGICVVIKGNSNGIAIATVIVYYGWLYICQHDFKQTICVYRKDIIYLLGYFIIFYVTSQYMDVFAGAVMYFIGIVIWGFILFKQNLLKAMYMLKKGR